MPEVLDLGGGDVHDPHLKIYNLDYAVGDSCSNKLGDVVLIQWLLKRHFSRKDKKQLLGDKFWLEVTGYIDSNTIDVIKVYQYDLLRTSKNSTCKIDGNIFPVRQLTELTKYELVNLNMSVHSYFPKQFRHPETDNFLTSEYKGIISRAGAIS
jgi:hypothetical protein